MTLSNKNFIKIIAFVFSSFFINLNAFSVDFGEPEILSPLGEKLEVQIPIYNLSNFSSIAVRTESIENYQKRGLIYSSAISTLSVSLQRDDEENMYLLLRSRDIINEPILDILLKTSWDSGKIISNFTIFLDPKYLFNARKKAKDFNFTGNDFLNENSTSKSKTEDEKLEEKKLSETLQDSKDTSQSKTDLTANEVNIKPRQVYGPVLFGNTLGRIAESIKPQSVSLEEMLVLLFLKNPNAFLNNNMNFLKEGVTLQIPQSSDYGELSFDQAKREVELQTNDWKKYKDSLAKSTQILSNSESINNTEFKGKVSRDSTKNFEESDNLKEKLELSKSSSVDPNSEDPQKKLIALEQDIIAKDKAIQDANQRLEKLEKTIFDLQKLLSIENNKIADLQASSTQDYNKIPPSPETNIKNPKKNDNNLDELEQDIENSEISGPIPKLVSKLLMQDYYLKIINSKIFDNISQFSLVKKIGLSPLQIIIVILVIIIIFIFLLLRLLLGKTNELESQPENESKYSKELNEIKENVSKFTNRNEPQGSSSNLDLSKIDLDLNNSKSSDFANDKKNEIWHEVQTKFDLAKAYEEMGDIDGATEILKEVMKEGSEEQKRAAQIILDKIKN